MLNTQEIDEFILDAIERLEVAYLRMLATTGEADTYFLKASFYYDAIRASVSFPVKDDVAQLRLIKAIAIKAEEFVTLYYKGQGKL